jgi:hypothetical protein
LLIAVSPNRVAAATHIAGLSALPFPVANFFSTLGPMITIGRPVFQIREVTAHHRPAFSCQYDPCAAE